MFLVVDLLNIFRDSCQSYVKSSLKPLHIADNFQNYSDKFNTIIESNHELIQFYKKISEDIIDNQKINDTFEILNKLIKNEKEFAKRHRFRSHIINMRDYLNIFEYLIEYIKDTIEKYKKNKMIRGSQQNPLILENILKFLKETKKETFKINKSNEIEFFF